MTGFAKERCRPSWVRNSDPISSPSNRVGKVRKWWESSVSWENALALAMPEAC